MIRVAIVDDDNIEMDEICEITALYFKERQKNYDIKRFIDPQILLKEIEIREVYDIFLLDINMEKMDGRQVAKAIQLKYVNPIIIFITNFHEYAVESYEYNIYRYILKNEITQKLPNALESCIQKLERRRSHEKFLEIEGLHFLERIAYKDIYYIKKEKKNVIIIHREGLSRIRMSMKELYDKLDEKLFVYTDRSYVVNLMHVNSIKDYNVYLSNDENIPVSIPRLKTVMMQVKLYQRSKEA